MESKFWTQRRQVKKEEMFALTKQKKKKDTDSQLSWKNKIEDWSHYLQILSSEYIWIGSLPSAWSACFYNFLAWSGDPFTSGKTSFNLRLLGHSLQDKALVAISWLCLLYVHTVFEFRRSSFEKFWCRPWIKTSPIEEWREEAVFYHTWGTWLWAIETTSHL